jgi:hypothetical protein
VRGPPVIQLPRTTPVFNPAGDGYICLSSSEACSSHLSHIPAELGVQTIKTTEAFNLCVSWERVMGLYYLFPFTPGRYRRRKSHAKVDIAPAANMMMMLFSRLGANTL